MFTCQATNKKSVRAYGLKEGLDALLIDSPENRYYLDRFYRVLPDGYYLQPVKGAYCYLR